MSPLNGKTFVFELSRDIRFKAKQELINYLREQNANISFILTASTDYVLVSNDTDTYKTRRAKQLGIPLVNVEYIYECRNLSIGKEPVDVKRFIVTSAEDKENFSKSGTIPVSGVGNSSSNTIKPVKFDVSKIKIWNSDDVELPQFDEITHAEIGKWAIFKETNENSDVYFALELQIIPEEYNETNRLRFRYEKQTITSSKGKNSLIQYAFSNDVNELQQLYVSYYNRIATMPRISRIRDLLPDKLGSKLLLRSSFLHRLDTQMLDDNVCQLIESLWIESIGDLNKILSVQPETIALKTIIQAEAALLEIKSDSKSASEAETRFYSLIPHRQSFVVDLINNRRALIDKTDLCQMLRDMVTVNELTNWNIKASIEAKYRALKCHIETLGYDTHEYATVCDMISSSTNQNEKVLVHQIYSIAKQTDALNFRSTLFNQKQLFHGSKFNNFLGILSRGLLMPKMVVNDLGITRTDIGCLGYGIYFSDSVSTSLKYTTPSTTRPGRRLLCISQVALGDSAKYYSYATNLTQPPDNFHSTHGVRKTNENNSKFVDDEYVVYNLDQQRLLYVVELSWIPHDNNNQSLNLLPIIRDQLSINRLDEVDIPSAIEDETVQVAEQDYGLICPSSGQLVPLKAFHIRAQLVDVTAEVVLYQVYHNTSLIPIEAKYVFPLDENCSVCGFEAHINNKIIKGVVKEKEQAKREYREAIEKGHGAYLMHQEQPEVFSVSVGNLPANCEVIIKITYVAELPIENNDIIFRLPAKVASWQSKQALEMKDQTILPSVNLEQDNLAMKAVEFSLKTSVRMPYEIMKLFSPTHRLRRKITDCIAMVELVDNILLEKDFILSVTLKTVNLPRMLNETYDLSDENSQSCMLTFYPKFEMNDNSNEFVEIVFIIDVSNSMDGNHVQQAKQLAHLFLTNMKYNDGNIYFNIVTFGSDNDECFPISSPNTKENIDKAKHFVLHSLDHRGNTDLFSVLRRYSLCPSPSKLGRQFILLSDGHINDLKSILTLLENQSSMRHDRLFTCSIGDISNKHNLKQLTNQANGGGLTTVFDSNYRSRWKTKVLQILEHIHQPCVTNISIDWHGTINNEQEKFTNQAPKIIRSLFNGMRLTVYRFIQNCHKATLTATINNQEFVTSVFSNKITETKGRILHCLTARSIIQDYENGLLDNDESKNELIKKQYKQDLIELSIKYSVVSSFTSFVAIEERDGEALQPGVRLLDVMLENDVDLLPYIGWEGDRSQIDLLKEKLIDGKRLFDSASISHKIQLINEYENLCKNISYRSGGDAKYELMLTLIDTYNTVLKEKGKAQELEEKMIEDLINEINNSTADERKILEKRLDEISIRFMQEKSEALDVQRTIINESPLCCYEGSSTAGLDYEDEDEDDESCMDNLEECVKEAVLTSGLPGDSMASSDESEMEQCFEKRKASVSKGIDDRKETKTIDTEESDEQLEYDLFDDEENMLFQPVVLKPQICAAGAAPAKKEEKKQLAESEDEDEGDDMGFGLFGDDDDVPASFPTASALVDNDECSVLPGANKVSSTINGKISSVLDLEGTGSLQLNGALSEDFVHANLSAETFDIQPLSKYISSKAQKFKAHSQLQQQQQQTINQPQYSPTSPSYSPISPSYMATNPNQHSSLASNIPKYSMQQMPIPSSNYAAISNPFGSSTNTTNTSIFSGFGALPQSQMTPSVPPPPPPPLPNALFSFGSPGSSVTNNFRKASSIFTGFGTTSQSVPPPPTSSLPGSSLFGSSSSGTSNTFGMPAMVPTYASPSIPSFGAPPPPPPSQSSFYSSSSLFGGNNNVFGTSATPAAFGTPQVYMHSTSQVHLQPHSLPGKGSFSFGTASSSYQPQLPPPPGASAFSFVTTSSSHHPQPSSSATGSANIPTSFAHTMNIGQSMFAAPPPPPTTVSQPIFTTSTTSLPLPPPPPPPLQIPLPTLSKSASSKQIETKSLLCDSSSQLKQVPTARYDECKQEESYSGDRGLEREKRSSFSGSRGRGSFLVKLRTSAGEEVHEPQMQSARYCDTRSDEQAIHIPRTKSPESELFTTSSKSFDNVKSKKKSMKDSKSSVKLNTVILQDLLLLDVVPLSLGVEDINGQMCAIISRNQTIPLKKDYSVFTNAYAYQTTATIRVFQGEHKLTKYNTLIGELTLTGLTPSFTSQTLEISICIDVDANGMIGVEAVELRSGAKAKITIDPHNYPMTPNDIQRHITFVESDPDFRAVPAENRRSNDPLYMLGGETENTTINFTNAFEEPEDRLILHENVNIALTSTTINEIKRIQLSDGSFDLNQDFANLLSIDINDFDEIKKYLSKQGFNSFALNIQNEIYRLIATGIILMKLFFQVPTADRKTYLVPFDHEQIRSILRHHLPKTLIENIDKAIHFYEQKRLRYGIYCEQLELKYSLWEKFIQYSLFHIDN